MAIFLALLLAAGAGFVLFAAFISYAGYTPQTAQCRGCGRAMVAFVHVSDCAHLCCSKACEKSVEELEDAREEKYETTWRIAVTAARLDGFELGVRETARFAAEGGNVQELASELDKLCRELAA